MIKEVINGKDKTSHWRPINFSITCLNGRDGGRMKKKCCFQACVLTGYKIICAHLPSFTDIFHTHIACRTITITGNTSNPSQSPFSLLPSGKRFQSLQACSIKQLLPPGCQDAELCTTSPSGPCPWTLTLDTVQYHMHYSHCTVRIDSSVCPGNTEINKYLWIRNRLNHIVTILSQDIFDSNFIWNSALTIRIIVFSLCHFSCVYRLRSRVPVMYL